MVPVVSPVPPIVVGPITNVQPFTYRDGETFASLLYRIRAYILELAPYIDGALEETIEKVDEAIAASNAWTADQINQMIDYVNEQVALIIGDSIQVQDPVVAGMFGDPTSQTRIVADGLYAPKSIVATVSANTSEINTLKTTVNTGRLSQTALDASYQAKGTVSDPAVAALVNTDATATIEAMRGRFSKVDEISLGDPMQQGAADISRTVALTGDSLMYGQDTTATGTLPPVNGATHTRSSEPPTKAFLSQSKFTSTSATVIVNQAYPGDRTAEALTRWANGSSGDAEFFWLGTNDAIAYGPGTPLTDAQSMANMAKLAKRARDRGAPFIVIGGAPVSNTRNAFKIFASSESLRTVAERYGAKYIDAGEILNDMDEANGSYWTDGVHWSYQAYSLIGARLAALLGPKGINPPKVSPGRRFTWMDNVWTGGSNVTVSSPNINGSVTRIVDAGAVVLSYDAVVPVRPLVKVRATTAAVVGIYSNLEVNRSPKRASINASGGEVVSIVGPPTMSPGPSAVTVYSESGSIDVLSIEFIGIDPSMQRYDRGVWTSGPIGGNAASRVDPNWDAVVFWDAAQPSRSGASQGSIVRPRFLFDYRCGGASSGVFIAASIDTAKYQAVDNGILVQRNGANWRMRLAVDGTFTDVSVASGGLFDSAGTITAVTVELYVDGTSVLVYANQVLIHTFTGITWKYFIPGFIAGNSANGFVAGTMTTNGLN